MSTSIRGRLAVLAAVLGLLAAGVVASVDVQAADHLESPNAQADGRTDITDLYAFQSPSNPDNTVVVLAVNPLAGVNGGTTFKQGANYEILIRDEKGYGARLKYKFGKVRNNGGQKVKAHLDGQKMVGQVGTPMTTDSGITWTTGLYDDPFFFDLAAFNDQVKAAGGDRTFCDGDEADFLAGTNVNAIVAEIPSDIFDGTNLKIWARTRVDGKIVDRVGRPAIATVLIPDGSEDDFNKTKPNRDKKKWSDDVNATLLALSGLDGTPYSEAEAQGITDFLLPDWLTIDTSQPTAFPNGRGLADDVIDAELGIVTGGFFGDSAVLTSDCVDANDKEFNDSFPYLAAAHEG